jgi:putative MATE family efflux protein
MMHQDSRMVAGSMFGVHLQPMSNSDNLLVQNTYRNIVSIALPISIGILIPQLNILTNTLFLGYYQPQVSTFSTQDLLAASGVAGIYYLTLVMMNYGLVAGILMLMSRKAGEKDEIGVGRLFSNGALLSLLMSLVLIIISWWFAPWLFTKTLHQPEVRDAAISFIKLRSWGLPFIVLVQLSNSLFLALSRSRLIIIGTVIQTFVNILFDYFLIFGIGIFPELGLEGTAIASVLAEVVYLLVAVLIIHGGQRFQSFQIRYIQHMNIGEMKRIFVKSSPLILQYFLSIGAWEVFYIYVEHLGKTESALSQLFRSVFGLVGVAAWALASTCNSMVSNLIGQHALDDVIPLIKKITGISFGVACVLGLPILLFPHFFLSLLTSDKTLVDTGALSLQIVVLATWMLSVSTIVFNAVLGTGRTTLNMIFEFVAIFFYLMYITITIEWLRLPLPYAWMSEFVYWLSLFLPSFIYFYSGYWRKHLDLQINSGKHPT